MLTPAQEKMPKERADLERAAFIRDLLSDDDKWVQSRMIALKTEINIANAEILKQQDLCSHPLVVRVIKNEGSSGNWDRDDHYWTSHRCEICDLRWSTNQSWKNVGGRLGLPNDKEATKND